MTPARQHQRRSAEGGYNLIEVLVAMAILSSVLLSIMTLFVFGRRNVYSGKQLTLANAVATRVSEDLVPLSRNNVYSSFGITNSTTLSSSVTIAGKTYTNVKVLSTDDTTTDPQGYLTRWKDLMAQKHFQKGRVSLVLTPTMAESGATFTSADILRIRVIVEWNEAGRARSVVVDTVKIDS